MERWWWGSAQTANAGSSGPGLEREGQLQLDRQLKHSWEAFARVSTQIAAALASSPDQPHGYAASVRQYSRVTSNHVNQYRIAKIKMCS